MKSNKKNEKKSFVETTCVTFTLHPRNEKQRQRLAEDLFAQHKPHRDILLIYYELCPPSCSTREPTPR